MSGGERQRISIARALLKDAPIVLLDEATASLDVENETKIQAGISELVRNKTVLIIAHRMRTVANADKIVVLENGSVAEMGTPEELKKKKWYICPDGEQTGYKYEWINSSDTMQFLKGDIQERILKVAEEVFLEKGYKDASMREIASRAGVTVSNIYHYFTNKDEIFRTILKPVLNDLYAMIYNHDADQMTIDVFMDSDYQKTSVREYIRLVSEHRDRLRLLLFRHKVLFWRTSVPNIRI